ncbi:MAG: hypothetical protein RRC34_06480 [Lentisphaeria bacterium]|nr:hypothetical protein [Lentisphaeria bacterium]
MAQPARVERSKRMVTFPLYNAAGIAEKSLCLPEKALQINI